MEPTPGLTTIESRFGPAETMTRLIAGIAARGLNLFARVDHAAGAAAVGMPLRPTELVIFGNARGGTPLMQLRPEVGIDLPLRALVWQDEAGRTWMSYEDPRWIAERHRLPAAGTVVAAKLNALLQGLAAEVTGNK
jgi:uncharacterized protein (DUF302 family)